MRVAAFSGRNAREIVRDPLNMAFGLGFPLVLLFLLSAIQANIPVALFEPDSLVPGLTVFGLSFFTLFAATLVARDRETALLQRLYTTPMHPWEFLAGYALPILPMALCQAGITYLAAVPLGLTVRPSTFLAIALLIPAALFFIALGLLAGSVLSVKQVGGICGALLTNLTAWFSGIWFDLDLVGGPFRSIAGMLPFVHAVDVERAALAGNLSGVLPHIWLVAGYLAAVSAAAVALFFRQMKNPARG